MGIHHHFSDVTERSHDLSRSGFLNRFDHRTLLIVWGVFVLLLVSISKYDLVRVLAFGAFPLFVIIADGLPLHRITLRVAALSTFVLFMAAANPFFDRHPLYMIGSFTVTGGMISAMVILAKTVVTLATVITLDMSISINGLCAALARLGVPTVFTTQILLLYRYCFVIADEASTMQKARNMRAFNGKGTGIFDTAPLMGSLLLRSTARSERIYKAMLARGFTGTIPSDSTDSFKAADAVFAATAIIIFLFLRFGM